MKLTKAHKEMLAKAGLTADSFTSDIPTEDNEATRERDEYEAQSLLTCLTWPYKEMESVKCERCGEYFLTNYTYTRWCSNVCVEAALREHFGIWWRPKAHYQEQWGAMQPPLTIGPRQIQAMRDLLSLIDQENPVESEYQDQDSEHQVENDSDSVSLDPPIPAIEVEIQSEHQEPDEDFLLLLESFPDE
jgi:hypothetical protein